MRDTPVSITATTWPAPVASRCAAASCSRAAAGSAGSGAVSAAGGAHRSGARKPVAGPGPSAGRRGGPQRRRLERSDRGRAVGGRPGGERSGGDGTRGYDRGRWAVNGRRHRSRGDGGRGRCGQRGGATQEDGDGDRRGRCHVSTPHVHRLRCRHRLTEPRRLRLPHHARTSWNRSIAASAKGTAAATSTPSTRSTVRRRTGDSSGRIPRAVASSAAMPAPAPTSRTAQATRLSGEPGPATVAARPTAVARPAASAVRAGAASA